METTTLRAYLDELDALLDQEALEEVIGHCRHILQHFPRNVETYRFLGRALLERGRNEDAREVFQRVLAAIPDDFTAHIGLSSTYEEPDINAAIWHLERAYEQDPHNEALQEELKRLRIIRDGSAPERVQLTDGALARLYLKSRLYTQATLELQKALEKQPDRVDLQLLLAQTLWDDGHIIAAGETALRVLEGLPNCIEANRILAALWVNAGRPAEAEPFIMRLEQLDPFLAWATVHSNGEALPRDAFQIPRLKWDARAAAALATDVPDWVATIGDVIEAPEPTAFSEESGDARRWSTEASGAFSVTLDEFEDYFGSQAGKSRMTSHLTHPVQEEAASPESASEIPEWLADAAEAATPADAMTWLATGPLPSLDELLPAGEAPAAPAEAPPPDWLQGTPEPEAEASDAMSLDWLLEGEEASEAPEVGMAAQAPAEMMDFELPDFGEIAPDQALEEDAAASLDWMLEAQPAPDAADEAGSDLFDFGFDLAPEAEAETPPSLEAEAEADAVTLDWLGNIAAPPEKDDRLVAETPDDINLDWMGSITAQAGEPAETVADADSAPPDTFDLEALGDLASEAAGLTDAAEQESRDWLEGTWPSAAEPTAEPGLPAAVEPEREPAAGDEDPMAWMKQFGLSVVEEGIPPVETGSAAEPPPDFEALDMPGEQEASAAEPAAAQMSPEAVLEWLRSTTDQPGVPASPPAEPVGESDMLEWLDARPGEPAEQGAESWLDHLGTSPVSADHEPVIEDDWLAAFETGAQTAEDDLLDRLETAESPPQGATLPAGEQPEGAAAPPAESAEDVPLWQRQVVTSMLPQLKDEPSWVEGEDELLAAADDIPQWMREAGDEAFATPLQEIEAPSGDVDRLVDPSALDLGGQPPVWGQTGVLGEEAAPDWLSAFGAEAAPTQEAEPEVEPEGEIGVLGEEAAPDWLSMLEAEAAPTPEAEPKVESEGEADWLQGMGLAAAEPEAEAKAARAGDDASDWLSGLGLGAEETPLPWPDEAEPTEESGPPGIAEAGEIPAWLQHMAPSGAEDEPATAPTPLEALDFGDLPVVAEDEIQAREEAGQAAGDLAQPGERVDTDTGGAEPDSEQKFRLTREPAWRRRKKSGE